MKTDTTEKPQVQARSATKPRTSHATPVETRQRIADAAVLLCTGAIAAYIYGLPPQWVAVSAIAVAALNLLLFHKLHTYGIRPRTEELTSAVRASRVLFWSALPFAIVALTIKPYWTTGLAISLYGVASWVGVVLNRTRYWQQWQKMQGRKLAVCGLNGDAISVADRLYEGEIEDTRTIVGVLTYDTDIHQSRWPRLGSSDDLVTLYQSGQFDEIIFSIPKSSSLVMPLSIEASRNHIPYRFFSQDDRGSLPSDMDRPNPRITSPMNLAEKALKRTFDIILSLTAVIAASPLFLILMIVIPLDSRGGFLFRQKRIGENGKSFTILKFRTMHSSASAYAECPMKSGDSRITRLGKILRATSLDEIPQFLNVLFGSMSIVGPRPEMPFIVNEYNDLERMRLNAKPGITGVWQLSSCRNRPIHENVHYDLFYIQNQSVTLDLILMLQTLFMAYKGI